MKILNRYDLQWKDAEWTGHYFHYINGSAGWNSNTDYYEYEALCVKSEHIPESSFFSKYPNAFDCIATASNLLRLGWFRIGDNPRCILWRHPRYSELIAYTFCGTVSHFETKLKNLRVASVLYSPSIGSPVYILNGRYVLPKDSLSTAPDTIIREIEKVYENPDL